MISMAMLAGLALALFGLAFLSKRRFGLLGLGLAAGFILSGLWHSTVEFMMSAIGVGVLGVSTDAVATAVLILLPPVVLLFHGYSYASITGRVIGASLFTVLALAFLIEPFADAIVLDGAGAQAVGWIASNSASIIGFGVMAAVLDVFISPTSSKYGGRGKGKK